MYEFRTKLAKNLFCPKKALISDKIRFHGTIKTY